MVHKNTSLRETLRVAERLGCEVKIARRTGEWLVWHSSFNRFYKVNCRRKDAPQNLISAIRRLEQVNASNVSSQSH